MNSNISSNVKVATHFKTSDAKIYKANLKGLRQYLESQKEINTSLYNSLDVDLKALEARSKTYWDLAILGYTIGGGLLAGGLFSTYSAPEEDRKTSPLTFIGIGTALLFFISGHFFSPLPKEKDVTDFIAKHNQLNVSNNIEIVYQ